MSSLTFICPATTRSMFDAPEFFRSGVVATIYGSERIMHVVGEGERCATYRGRMLRTPEEFRAAFPDSEEGVPDLDIEFEWTNNGWFKVYENNMLARDPEPVFSLREAISIAIEEANYA
jgi:hypothetical protein